MTTQAPEAGAAVVGLGTAEGEAQQEGVPGSAGWSPAVGVLSAALPGLALDRESERLPTLVLGGSGYVAGELLRLLVGHPRLRPALVVSDSRGGESVEATFPHLGGCLPGVVFCRREELAERLAGNAVLPTFCAAPHGAAAKLVDEVCTIAAEAGCDLPLVDLSADFRFATAGEWERVYGHPHGAPARVAEFVRGVPELVPWSTGATPSLRRVAHPGCFTTAVLLGATQLLRAGLVEPEVVAVATTGSTGAGRTPTATTHHPERRNNLFAYSPLQHRHQPEMEALLQSAGAHPHGPVTVRFVPQAGPFARGIYATLVMRPRAGTTAATARQALAAAYAGSPFVGVADKPPQLLEVAGTNRCRLAVAQDGDTLIVFSALDNLVKGAAGGGMQWMNRLLGLPESLGLLTPGLGWA